MIIYMWTTTGCVVSSVTVNVADAECERFNYIQLMLILKHQYVNTPTFLSWILVQTKLTYSLTNSRMSDTVFKVRTYTEYMLEHENERKKVIVSIWNTKF